MAGAGHADLTLYARGDTDGTGDDMKLSARNQIPGTVTSVSYGNVMCEVVVDIGGGSEMVSAITKASAESLGLEVGAAVTVVVKATEVLLARD